jgi:hypothetical protein
MATPVFVCNGMSATRSAMAGHLCRKHLYGCSIKSTHYLITMTNPCLRRDSCNVKSFRRTTVHHCSLQLHRHREHLLPRSRHCIPYCRKILMALPGASLRCGAVNESWGLLWGNTKPSVPLHSRTMGAPVARREALAASRRLSRVQRRQWSISMSFHSIVSAGCE